MVNAVWVDALDDADEARVRTLLLAAREADGRPELGADGVLPAEFRGGAHLLASLGEELVGYAHLDTAGDAYGRQVGELIVHPDRRRGGVATRMVPALVEKAGATPPTGSLRVWSHGDHPAASRLAERAGFTRVRELMVLRAKAGEQDWPPPVPPDGIRLRTFVPGQDEEAMLAVNARAFAWHPEQGALTAGELRTEEAQSWFDPDGFFLAEGADGRVAGFHWTKIHPPNPARFGGEPVGEVYVLGVDPSAHGGGLGKALTLAGLRYLRDRGLRQVILYVEGENAAALAVYRRFGFTTHETDVQYAR